MAYYGEFETQLWEVWKDSRVALLTLLACPVQAALNKAALDNRSCSILDLFFGCGFQEYYNRQQLRAKYGFDQSAYEDCLSTLLCPLCMTCQDAREIKHRQQCRPDEMLMS
eukprot:GGOE01020333.1.p2 GENE.GGOE01020333.1~~GGOE01020333.1.p2  ORF type:complete len:120 (-),score=42.20 GGOE01020333.1:614-946(-)